MSIPVIILGAGGHAKVLIEALRRSGSPATGIVTPDLHLIGNAILGVPVLGGDDILTGYDPAAIMLVNGVGSVGPTSRRRELYQRMKEAGYSFATVVHPSAVIASDAELGEGAQVMAGSVIQPGSRIGCNSIVNTRASVDHDCEIGDHVHIAPGVTLSGGVTVGPMSHIGTGATVIQGVHIGAETIVGAGTLVLKDVPAGIKVVGVPARMVKE